MLIYILTRSFSFSIRYGENLLTVCHAVPFKYFGQTLEKCLLLKKKKKKIILKAYGHLKQYFTTPHHLLVK